MPPIERFQLVTEVACDGVRVAKACRELGVSRAGDYESRHRGASARAIRHAWLTDLIAAIHEVSGETYGALRITAELVHAHGIVVGKNSVGQLMRRLGRSGLPLRRRGKRAPNQVTMIDHVKRNFPRMAPINSGSRISRSIPRPRANSTAAASSMSCRGEASAGTLFPSSRGPSHQRARDGDRLPR